MPPHPLVSILCVSVVIFLFSHAWYFRKPISFYKICNFYSSPLNFRHVEILSFNDSISLSMVMITCYCLVITIVIGIIIISIIIMRILF